MLVIEDGLERDTMAQLIRSSQCHTPPVALPRCLLAYRVLHYDPFDYSNLMENWAPVHGRHPLAEVAPPGKEEFAAYALHRIASFLTFTRGDELFSGPLSVTVLERGLDFALGGTLLLRTDWVPPRQRNVAQRWRSEFPLRSEAFEKIKTLLGEDRIQEARRASFDLFRSIARDARDLLSPPPGCP